nr:hypothetical protein [Ophiocordyceps lanpingensis]
MAVGALIGGSTVTVVNALGGLYKKNIDNAVTSGASKSNPTTPPTSNPGGGDGGAAFSIEPAADLDTVMSLLDANLILHIWYFYNPEDMKNSASSNIYLLL